MPDELKAQLADSVVTLGACEGLLPAVREVADACVRSLRASGAVAFCGNGGSASQAQHFAAELVGRFRRERAAFRAIALTTDSSILTAIGNDYSFDQVFARQVEGLLGEGDVLVGLSTSGTAGNVVRAFEAARARGVVTVGFTGKDGGPMAALCDHELRVPAEMTARIQEAHLLLGHLLCDCVEAALAG
jgi:D-sedoheptulose 7-phosphate isomerase